MQGNGSGAPVTTDLSQVTFDDGFRIEGFGYDADDFKYIDIAIRNKQYRVREMTGTARDRWEQAVFKLGADGKVKAETLYLRARLVSNCLYDRAGARVCATERDVMMKFSDDRPDGILGRLFECAQKVSGIGDKAKEDATKNFAGAPSASSIADLPSHEDAPSLNS
jgi:hypothetical protein